MAPPRPPPGPSPQRVEVRGAPPTPFRDVYHAFLHAPWPVALGQIVAVYVALNMVFALAFVEVGSVANARPGSFEDAFYFSVQTMGTIGYGNMYPSSRAAELLVVCESVLGLVFTALATGLVFAKFGRATARVMFTRQVVIAPLDGVPTLMVRVGNERSNRIVDAHFRIALVRTERSKEGVKMYRMYDLDLIRPRTAALSRSYTLMHRIGETSPLYGYSPERFAAEEVEFDVEVLGIDDTTLQTVHALRHYEDPDVIWGARHADILDYSADGVLQLDLERFHETVPTEPIEGFPYPR